MRRAAQRKISTEEALPLNSEGGFPHQLRWAEINRACAAWLTKRGMRPRKFMEKFGKPLKK